ncbi:MAG: integrase core domain-containing protein [Patescibacteria group bacterium]|nr:integrase core domain-containing protein [Patescibacteria group bacterium]MDD5294435.1 integrase core domain-containing protein [Patescibacteria group bacterium]MDD5554109.1 integrase core domain-containing protein [Patescibacteria group bacterium]
MPKSTQEEKYRWIKPILGKEISIKQMAKVCSFSERALKYWLANFRLYGRAGLENKSTRPKSQPNETPIRIKERVIELRNETKLCAKKLNYKLKKENILIHDRTIGKIIKTEGLVRKYRIRKLKYKYVKLPLAAGELVEIDIKFVPKRLGNKRYYQFTAIDCATRWRYLKIYDNMGNGQAIDFFEELKSMAPFRIRTIKTDNGSCFTNRYTGYLRSADPLNPRLHPFDLCLMEENNILHYLIDPGKPAQNGKAERSHRTDQEMFYDRRKFKTVLGLKRALKQWNNNYNNLEHCALDGLTPNEALARVQNVCA